MSRFLGLALAIVTLSAASASAAAITWGSAQNISGDSDVSTTGTLLYAYNIGPAGVGTTSVSGVSFAAFAFPIFTDFQDTAQMQTSRSLKIRGCCFPTATSGQAQRPILA